MDKIRAKKNVFKRRKNKSNDVCLSVFFGTSQQEPAVMEENCSEMCISTFFDRRNREVTEEINMQITTRTAAKRVLKEEFNNNVKKSKYTASVNLDQQTGNAEVNCSTFKDFVSKKYNTNHFVTCDYCKKLHIFFKRKIKLHCDTIKDFVSKKYIPDHLKKCRFCAKLQLFLRG